MAHRIVYLMVDISDLERANIAEITEAARWRVDTFVEEHLTELGDSYDIDKNLEDTGFEDVVSGTGWSSIRPLEDVIAIVKEKKSETDRYIKTLEEKIKFSAKGQLDSYACYKYGCAKEGILSNETLVYDISCDDDIIPEGEEMCGYFVVAVSVHS